MPESPLPLDSLFSDAHLQEFAADLIQLRNRDNEQLDKQAWIAIARCIDQPYRAHANIDYWDTLIVDRQHVFSYYLWPLIKERPIGQATRDDVLTALHNAAQHVRDNNERLRQTLSHVDFLGPPTDV